MGHKLTLEEAYIQVVDQTKLLGYKPLIFNICKSAEN